MPERLRLLIYTCGGGHDGLNQGLPNGKINWLPSALRRRLLARGLSFKPDALIANGDQIYWDLRAPQASKGSGASALGRELAGIFDRAQPVFGTPNETVFRRATAAQIIPQYGALLRSTPVFFMQDDHDYFDNDEATDDIITFPPDAFMLSLARATRTLYYPEYLPDRNRPLGLPGASAPDGRKASARRSARCVTASSPKSCSTTCGERRHWPDRARCSSTARWRRG